jgi:hypothetical protein
MNDGCTWTLKIDHPSEAIKNKNDSHERRNSRFTRALDQLIEPTSRLDHDKVRGCICTLN